MAQFTNLVGCVLFVVAVGAKMEIFPEQGVITTKQWMADALRRGIEVSKHIPGPRSLDSVSDLSFI